MMDVDNDIEGQLLQQFSCMGTQDKEVLISQFQHFLGNQISQENCIFYLDMNNWNLQAAIGSYYDYEQQPQGPQMKLPCMALVNDVTIGEGEAIPPNTPFVKTWRVKNSGSEPWPPGCALHYIAGVMFGSRDRVMVHSLQPGEHTDISINMTSPQTLGIHQGQWRMQMPTGMYFGDIIWVIVQVEENGLLGVTQQLSNIGSSEFVHPASNQQVNPFGTPVKTESHSTFPGQLSPVMSSTGALFSSPTPSMITHVGSLPSSPASSLAPLTSHQASHTPPSSGICTALFQSPGHSSIPPMEGNPPPPSPTSHDVDMS